VLNSKLWAGVNSPAQFSKGKNMKYLVLKRFRANGVTYNPGTAAEFQEETAKHLLAIGRIEPDNTPTKVLVEEVVEDVVEEEPKKETRVTKPRKTRKK